MSAAVSMAEMWHVRGERWESIPHRVLRDKRLTFRARGLLCYLLSLPDGWQTSVERLRDLTPPKEPGQPYEGREALEGAVRELERGGYLYRWRKRTDGRMAGYIWAYSADPDALRSAVAQHCPEVVDNLVDNPVEVVELGVTVSGSAVNGRDQQQQAVSAGHTVYGSPGNGADQPKRDTSAGRPVYGSPGDLRRTDPKNFTKNSGREPALTLALVPASDPETDGATEHDEEHDQTGTLAAEIVAGLTFRCGPSARQLDQIRSAVASALRRGVAASVVAEYARRKARQADTVKYLVQAFSAAHLPVSAAPAAEPVEARPALPPLCGQCEAKPAIGAYPEDPVSARIVWLDADRTRSQWCPRCHPRALAVTPSMRQPERLDEDHEPKPAGGAR